MKCTFKTLAAAALAALVLAAVAGFAYAAGVSKRKVATIWEMSDLVWEPYAPGATLQVASADSEAVLIQGTWVHAVDGDPTSLRDLAPGSYVFQPGKQDHDDACKGKVDCIVFVHQRARGDFVPAKSSGGQRSLSLPSPSSSPIRSLTSRE